MGRSPCCSKEGLNRGAWTALEDKILTDFIKLHGEGKWRSLPKRAGLKRCGKSCRLRWLNYLRPDIKRGNITSDEEDLIIRLHKLLGNRWSLIAGRLPGRTDNEIKNYWNTTISKKLQAGPPAPKHKISNHGSKRSLSPPTIQPPPTSHITSSPRKESYAIRPRASRCTRIFISSDPQYIIHDQFLPSSSDHWFDGDVAVGPGRLEEAGLPLIFKESEPSDFLMDFDVDDKFLADFFTTDIEF